MPGLENEPQGFSNGERCSVHCEHLRSDSYGRRREDSSRTLTCDLSQGESWAVILPPGDQIIAQENKGFVSIMVCDYPDKRSIK